MKRSLLIVLASVTALGTTASADVSVLDNNKTLTIDCAKDKQVNLVGNRIKATLVGTCDKVSVTGNHETVIGSAKVVYVAGNSNELTIEAADTITLAGNKNTLSWKRGVTGPRPKLSNVGTDNKVTQAK